jgi:hypothetical protein
MINQRVSANAPSKSCYLTANVLSSLSALRVQFILGSGAVQCNE